VTLRTPLPLHLSLHKTADYCGGRTFVYLYTLTILYLILGLNYIIVSQNPDTNKEYFRISNNLFRYSLIKDILLFFS
jgi:hypothetical protein